MSMLSPNTILLNRAAPSGKFICCAALQPRKHLVASVALPWIPSKQSRAPLFVCLAKANGTETRINTDNTPPSDLQVLSLKVDHDDLRIMDDKDDIKMKFKVGAMTEVTLSGGWLEITIARNEINEIDKRKEESNEINLPQ